MSFRKTNSFCKTEKKSVNLETSIRPFESLIKLLTRNSHSNSHKRNESFSFSSNSSMGSKHVQPKEFDFLWNLELVLIYTSNVLRQKLDDLNRVNLIQQCMQCTHLIEAHLKESQTFIDNLHSSLPLLQSVKESLSQFKNTHDEFYKWIMNDVNSTKSFDHQIAQDLFFNMEIKAKIFIEKLKRILMDTDKDFKRSSIDNSSLLSLSLRSNKSECSRKSCFSDEDRKLIDKLKELDQNIDLPPPKPAVLQIDQDNLESFLNQVEQVMKSQSEPEYDYSMINTAINIHNNNSNYNQTIGSDVKSVKLENNCIMASSMISNEILPVDMDSAEEYTPTPNENKSLTNEFPFQDTEVIEIPKTIICDRARNFPLPPVPSGEKTLRPKLSKIVSNFPSEDISYRKACLMESDQSKVINGSIVNFNRNSPLRSPTLINSLNLSYNRSSAKKLPIALNDCFSSNSGHSSLIVSPYSEEKSNCRNSNSSHPWLLMAKQIPSIVDDTNDLLNITDMQDDINIITQPFDVLNVDDKVSCRLSEMSNRTDLSIQSDPQCSNNSNSLVMASNNNDMYCNSEIKSDTEEYFEYFEIDGNKYRRRMKKRTVIEKIKIRKTILAPMKADGSGPDLRNDEDCTICLDSDVIDRPNDTPCDNAISTEYCESKPRFRRGHEDRFRVSKSMFYPYKDQMKRITLCHPSYLKSENNSKLNPLLNKYMYRFGESDFEEPVIDKRFSTQLTDSVTSTWIKTSESILPHEKSKSICFLKKYREKDSEGSTIHNSVRVTASRTVRMKIPESTNQEPKLTISPISLHSNAEEEESVIEGEESDTSLGGTDTRSSQFDSVIQSSDDDKEDDEDISFLSDSVVNENENISPDIVEDKDFQEENLEESLDSEIEPSKRIYSSDSSFFSSRYSTYSLELKEQHSFILTENSATPYLIFDEESKYGECDIAGGPVDALIVYACDGKEHLLFLGAFLDTYRTFIEPKDLIDRLIIRYKHFRNIFIKDLCQPISRHQNDETNIDKVSVERKCNHVLSLLLTVIGKLKRDFTQEISEQIENFQNYLRELKQEQWTNAISTAISTQRVCTEADDKLAQKLKELSTQPNIQNEQKSPIREFSSTKILINLNSKMTILNFSSREIAEQITLLDWSKYRNVELMEILKLKDIINCNLPGVIEYAKNFENVQYWTQSILLDPERMSDKDKGCFKFIRIMKHLHRLKNFSSLIAILLAIQLLPLKKLFSKRVRSKIREYDNYMKPPRFTGYKEDLKQASAPCIPFLGLFYQDIVMLNIANPPYLELDEILKLNDRSNFSVNNNQLLLSNSVNCGRIVNFWRSFKQYLFLKNCNKDQDKIRYPIEPNEKILHFLNGYRDNFDEATIQRMIKQLV